MSTPTSTPTTTPTSELAYLTACYNQLRVHVRDVHDVDCYGTAGQIEAVHHRAHRTDGSAWHDAWTMPPPHHDSHHDHDHDSDGGGGGREAGS